jgi:hypothetical protein
VTPAEKFRTELNRIFGSRPDVTERDKRLVYLAANEFAAAKAEEIVHPRPDLGWVARDGRAS